MQLDKPTPLVRTMSVMKRAAPIAVMVAVAAVFGWRAMKLQVDPDPLAVLPAASASVFREVAARFHSLDVLIVGVDAGDALSPASCAALAAFTHAAGQMKGVEQVLSLTSVEDAVEVEGGVKVDYLVRAPPRDEAEAAALRAKVLSRDAVAGTLVSRDGTALAIYAFLTPGADGGALAGELAQRARDAFQRPVHLYGAPVVVPAILAATRADLAIYVPIGAALMFILVAVALRSPGRALLALLPALVGCAVSVGAAQLAGASATPVLMLAPLVVLVPAVLVGAAAAAGTTPGRVLALGLGAAAVISVGLQTAYPQLDEMVGFALLGVGAASVAAAALAQGGQGFAPVRSRALAGLALAVAVAGGFGWRARVANQDSNALLPANSEAARGARFLAERFGGASYAQIEVAGDLTDPAAIAAVDDLADRLARVEGVDGVQHLGTVLAQANAAISGDEAIPDTAAKARALYQFVAGRASVRQLVDDERRHTLLQVRVRPGSPATLAAVEAEAAKVGAGVASGRRAAKLAAAARRLGLADADAVAAKLVATPSLPPDPKRIRAWLDSDDLPFDVPPAPDGKDALARDILAGNEQAFPDGAAPAVKDLVARESGRAAVEAALAGRDLAEREHAIRVLLGALFAADAAAPVKLAVRVTGQPVLDRDLGIVVRSVHRTLGWEAALAAFLVALLLGRALAAALFALGGLGVFYAAAGLGHAPLDIASMVIPLLAGSAAAITAVTSRGLAALAVAALFAPLALAATPSIHAMGMFAALALAWGFTCCMVRKP